jgi:SSS family solute:Na+ symporter
MIAYLMFAEFDFSWSAAIASVPDGNLSMIRPIDDSALPWLGTLIGVPILGFYYWGTNQYIVQRVLGARDIKNARWGALLGGFLKLPVLFIMVIPGVFAFSIFPNLTDPDMVFPTMVANMLPVGITGIVLAGLIAAIMSSIDSTLNSASTLITMDFIKPRNPNLTAKETGKIGRWTTIILMAVACTWAPLIEQFDGIFQYIQEAFAYIVPPVVAIFILGMFWRRGNRHAAFWTLVSGHSLSAFIFVLVQMEIVTIHFTITAGLLTLICCVIFAVTSVLGEKPDPKQIDDVIFKTKDIRPEEPDTPLLKDYRFHSVIVLILTTALVISFW